MDQWKSVDEMLDFAIGEEEAAANFYEEWAGKMERRSMRDVLLSFAREEKGHKEKLLNIKAKGTLQASSEIVTDLKVSDYFVEIKPSPDMGYADILIIAMKKEKAAFKLYSELASAADSEALKSAFLALAQEEAKHKLRFELEYDDHMTDN